jgi:hypothetical protein
MQIDRSNYEIWLIDWIDGKLNRAQIELVIAFLEANPDIKEEMEDIKSFRLTIPDHKFKGKHRILKPEENSNQQQFEYQCVSYLENDLSGNEKAELIDTISRDPSMKGTFDLIQKMKIVPSVLVYRGKQKLIKRTLTYKVIRISAIGLSAAAMIAIALMTNILSPDGSQVNPVKSPEKVIADNRRIDLPVNKAVTTAENTVPTKAIPTKKRAIKVISGPQSSGQSANSVKNDSRVEIPQTIPIINVTPGITYRKEPVKTSLIALNSEKVIAVSDDGRSKLGKTVARTFREKILKEKAPKDTPLSGYEIAAAGVSGLNKLFGWEMALDEKHDQKGNPKSVYFSSKILKIKAPVKKTELVQ